MLAQGITDTLLTAVIVAVISPVILLILTGRQRRKEKEADWEREDEVAAKAAEVVAALRADSKELAQGTREVARVAAEAKESTDYQLERIHTLVNSNLTSQMEDSLVSKKAEFAALLEVVDLKRAAGREPTEEALSTLKLIRSDIVLKEAQLAERIKAATQAEKDANIALTKIIKKGDD